MIDLHNQPNFEDIEAIRGGHLITEARLFEEKHIVREFDECINDITNHIKLFKTNKDDMIGKYSGWYYNIEEHECRRIHNPELYHPIFIAYKPLTKKGEYGSTIEREDKRKSKNELTNDPITIFVSSYVESPNQIHSILKHEFVHVRQMCSKPYTNNISNLKNTMDSNPRYKEEIPNTLLEYCTKCLYYMVPTEQSARINAVYDYIVHMDSDEVYSVVKHCKNRNEMAVAFMYYTDDFSMNNNYVAFIDDLKDKFSSGEYICILVLGIIMKLHHVIYDTSKYLTKEFFREYKKDMYNPKYTEDKEFRNVMALIVERYRLHHKRFEQDLFNIIHKAFDEFIR